MRAWSGSNVPSPPSPLNRPPLVSGRLLAAAWILLLGAALAVRIAAIVSPVEDLVTLVPDDAFYYFETAQRLWEGQGSTFDGVDRADGYQPLWMALLTPLAWLPALTFVRFGLALGVLLHLVAVVGLARFVTDVTGRPFLGWLAAVAYLGNRWATFSSFNGLETAVTSAIFCWTMVAVLRTAEAASGRESREQRNPLPWRPAALVGALAGLLFLARTDQVFYGAAFLLFVWASTGGHRTAAIRLGIATLAVSLPWFLWHWAAFGHPLPSSGSAQPLIQRTLTELAGRSVEDRSWSEMRGFFTGRIVDFPGFDRRLLVPLLLAAGMVTTVSLRHLEPAVRRALILLGILAAAALALGFVHSYLRWYPRTWYFDQYIPLVVSFLLVSVHLAQRLAVRWSRLKQLASAVLVSSALLVLTTAAVAQSRAWSAVEHGIYPGQRPALEAVQLLDATLPADAAVAGWNSGIVAFFSERSVVNLDGAISATTLEYLRDRDLTSLLCAREIHAIVDHGVEFSRYRAFLPALDELVAAPPVWLDEEKRGWLIQPLGESERNEVCRQVTD